MAVLVAALKILSSPNTYEAQSQRTRFLPYVSEKESRRWLNQTKLEKSKASWHW